MIIIIGNLKANLERCEQASVGPTSLLFFQRHLLELVRDKLSKLEHVGPNYHKKPIKSKWKECAESLNCLKDDFQLAILINAGVTP